MQTKRRWLKTMLAASAAPQPALPWQCKPAPVKAAPQHRAAR